MTLPDDAQARKSIPLATGLLDYFPSALVAVAALSAKGNDQHNPGMPLHWDRAKSGDEADALVRHLLQRGTVDTDGVLHSTKVAWRALASLQKELEAAGAPVAPGAVRTIRVSGFDPNTPVQFYEDPAAASHAGLSDAENARLAAMLEVGDEYASTANLKAGEAHEHDHAAYTAATASLTPEGS